MIIKPQGRRNLKILTVVLFCIALSIQAQGSENASGPLNAGTIIDQPVFDTQGQELGELEDLVIKRNGSVKRALISIGGVLEMGDKLVAVPYRSIGFTNRGITYDITAKELENQPRYGGKMN